MTKTAGLAGSGVSGVDWIGGSLGCVANSANISAQRKADSANAANPLLVQQGLQGGE
jgi:hypothetical protein